MPTLYVYNVKVFVDCCKKNGAFNSIVSVSKANILYSNTGTVSICQVRFSRLLIKIYQNWCKSFDCSQIKYKQYIVKR